MTDSPPDLIAINHDDHCAEHVGRAADGRQFFLTNPFVPTIGADVGCEFVALYLFDAAGKFVEAKIDEFGPRASMDKEEHSRIYQQRLQELGDVTFGRIEVAPFAVERFGTTFGLIPRHIADEDDSEFDDEGESWWVVEAMPGNYMAFHDPWDDGDYDT